MVRVLGGGTKELVPRPRYEGGEPSDAQSRRRRACALLREPVPTTSSTTFPWGWDELEGIANRTDFDLKAHAEHSGKDLTYFDQEADERFYPYVIEPAAGATRTTFAFLIDAFHEEIVNEETRTVLRLDPRLAPIKWRSSRFRRKMILSRARSGSRRC